MSNVMWDLKEKVAVITGSSRGIGKSIAITYAKAGCNIVLNYLNNDAMAEKTVETVREYDVQCIRVKADISKPEGIEYLIDCAKRKFGPFDIWVNNAGVYIPKLLLQTTEAEYEKVIDINLRGSFFATKLAIKSMINSGKEGSIINISSYSALFPEAYGSIYAASKSGVLALTKVAAKEYGHKGIRVNAILPGFVNTDMNQEALRKVGKSESFLTNYVNAEDIGEFCCFLASDLSNYITGKYFEII